MNLREYTTCVIVAVGRCVTAVGRVGRVRARQPTCPTMRPLKVLSVDLGTKNFCFCYYDGVAERVLRWERLALPPRGKLLLIPRLAAFLSSFQTQYAEMVAEATHVAIEQQMTSTMRIMEAVMYTQYMGKSQSLNPRMVKAYFRHEYPDMCEPLSPTEARPSRNVEYRRGKKMAMLIARDRLLPLQDVAWQTLYAESSKQDDLADSLLQAVYLTRRVKEAWALEDAAAATAAAAPPPPVLATAAKPRRKGRSVVANKT